MHLGDYETEKDEIEVYCGKHIPEFTFDPNGILAWYEEESGNRNWFFIKYLTNNAKKNWRQNHPNVSETIWLVHKFGKIINKEWQEGGEQ